MGRIKIMMDKDELIRCDTCENFDYEQNMYQQTMQSGNTYYHCSICQNNYNVVCREMRKESI